MALRPNESGYYVAIFTCWWLSILFDIIFAFLANGWCAAFAVTFQKNALVFESLWEFYSGKKCMRHKTAFEYEFGGRNSASKSSISANHTYLLCWNSDRQYVHLTMGNDPRHSYKWIKIHNFLFFGTNKMCLMKILRFLSNSFLNEVILSLLRLLIVRFCYRS